MIDGAIHVIPTPSRIGVQEGVFSFSESTRVIVDESSIGLWDVAEHLIDRIAAATGFRLDLTTAAEGAWEPNSLIYTHKGSGEIQSPEGVIR